MTKEEAKEILTHNWTRVDNPNYSESELDEAFFMAIEALQAETIPLSVADKIGEERERLQEKVAELQEKNADRPHGVWEYTEVTTDNDTYSEWVCSECGGSGYELMDFCPWCGADMRGDDE